MHILNAETTADKNRLYSDTIYAVLLKIVLPNGETFRFSGDSDDTRWQGELYQSFPFEFEEMVENSSGELPRYNINVSNVDRQVESYMQQVDGGIGSAVSIYVVNKTLILQSPNANADITVNTTAKSASTTAEWVTFTLGARNPFTCRIPWDRILKNHCRFRFKGSLCMYSGQGATCNKTFEQCRQYNNSNRYGGFVGAGGAALYL